MAMIWCGERTGRPEVADRRGFEPSVDGHVVMLSEASGAKWGGYEPTTPDRLDDPKLPHIRRIAQPRDNMPAGAPRLDSESSILDLPP